METELVLDRWADEECDVMVNHLAKELEVDPSNLRKFIKKHEFEPFLIRAADTGNQPSLALTKEDAEQVKSLWLTGKLGQEAREQAAGWFYIIMPVPEVPGRLKIGFTSNLSKRLAAYQVICPSACILEHWFCQRSWEYAARDSITRKGCTRVGSEVFDCEDVAAVIENAKQFFALMPKLGKEGPNDQHN